MDRLASGRVHGTVSLVAVDLIGRIFGRGRRRRSRFKSGNVGGLERYSRLQDRSCSCVNLTPIKNLDGTDDSAEKEDELRVLQQRRPRSSFSSDDSSKGWTSSTDHYSHRRRKGFYCLRLRIVNMVRIVAMMRKVRLAYRRMMNAAVASKSILSLADLYNEIADLIPVPCSSNNEARTIVVIRPIKCTPGPSQDDEEEERPGFTYGQGFCARSSSARDPSVALRPFAGHDAMSTSGPAGAVADHIPSSSWRKFALRSFSCVCTSTVTSRTSPLSS